MLGQVHLPPTSYMDLVMHLNIHLWQLFTFKLFTVMATSVSIKNTVAPIKKQTIPRLELLGANILARLFNTVQNTLKSLPQMLDRFIYSALLDQEFGTLKTVCPTSGHRDT